MSPESYSLATSPDDPTVLKERWVACLSDGTTIHENAVEDELAAWTRLSHYCKDAGLSINSLSLLIAGTEIKLPEGQEGYLQKKVAWASPGAQGVRKCIGYVLAGRALIYEVSSDRDSVVIRGVDPGEPFTIYSKHIRDGMEKYAVA